MKSNLVVIGILICSAAACQTKSLTTDQKQLFGTWVSTDDKAYQVIFKDSIKQDYYNKELQSTFTYQLKNDSLIVKDKGDGMVYYYAIMGLSRTNLTLMNLGRGNLLKFRKK